jgi:hypothetical protein
MKKSAIFAALTVSLCMFIPVRSFAQVPASAPAGTTGLCKDGSFSSNASKKGACNGHKGVKTWYGAAASASAAASAPASVAASAPGAAALATATPATAASASTAMGGGPGQVWVNTSTKVYHCQGDKFYGKTKHGQFMSEAAAKAAGDHAAAGKACS